MYKVVIKITPVYLVSIMADQYVQNIHFSKHGVVRVARGVRAPECRGRVDPPIAADPDGGAHHVVEAAVDVRDDGQGCQLYEDNGRRLCHTAQ